MATSASFWYTTLEPTKVVIRINPDPNYAYYTVVVRLASDASDSTYYKNHASTYPEPLYITVTGLDPETEYAMNVGYNNTGNLSVEGWIGTQYFTTPALTNSVKIVYNANGGSGAPSSQTVTSSSSSRIRVTLRTGEPTRSGYTFLGWSLSSTATTPTYYAGSSYYFDGSSSGVTYTLYAVWSKNATYYAKIVYDADGGSGAPSSQTVSGSSSAVSVTLRAGQPTRSGFEFQGWSTTQGATVPTYYPGETYTFQGSTGTTTTTLYAVWLEVEYYVRIHYVTDHGETVYKTYSGAQNSQVPVTMPTLSSDIPGLEFQGWATEVPASTVVYEPGKTYNFTGGAGEFQDYELYAVWEARYLVTLHFDANGGEGAPASKTFTGQTASVTCEIPTETPTKADHTFAGWSCDGNTYDIGKTYTFTGSAFTSTEYTLVAVWTQGTQVGSVCIGSKLYDPYIYTGGRWIRATPRKF